jgi:hypothetical protein
MTSSIRGRLGLPIRALIPSRLAAYPLPIREPIPDQQRVVPGLLPGSVRGVTCVFAKHA